MSIGKSPGPDDPEVAVSRKATWRKRLSGDLRGLGTDEKHRASNRIRELLLGSPWLARDSLCCLMFAPMAEEPDLLPLLDHGRPQDDDRQWIFPLVQPGRRLTLHRVTDPAVDLVPGSFGLLEPDPARCPVVSPGEIDLVLVPGLGFGLTPTGDEAGLHERRVKRLGRGGGYFDRLIPRLPAEARLVGVGFDLQWFAEVPWPLESHDQPLDAMVTEQGWRYALVGEEGSEAVRVSDGH